MPLSDQPLLRFLARNCVLGVTAGWVLLGFLIYLDVARLGQLLFASDQWLLTLLLASVGFGVTFGGLAMATAIFLLPKE